VDQVGVNAPGRPTIIMFLSIAYSLMFTMSGGKPWWRLMNGNLSPTFTAMDADVAAKRMNPLRRLFILRRLASSYTVCVS